MQIYLENRDWARGLRERGEAVRGLVLGCWIAIAIIFSAALQGGSCAYDPAGRLGGSGLDLSLRLPLYGAYAWIAVSTGAEPDYPRADWTMYLALFRQGQVRGFRQCLSLGGGYVRGQSVSVRRCMSTLKRRGAGAGW